MNWKEEYNQKKTSFEEAIKLIKPTDRVYFSCASSIPYGILEALWEHRHEYEGLTIQCTNGYGPCSVYDNLEDNPFKFETFFMGPHERKVMKAGFDVKYTSVHLSQVDIWGRETARPDVCCYEVSKPDDNGYFSFGPSGAATNSFPLDVAKKVILQVNACVPYTFGQENRVHISDVDAIVEFDRPIGDFPTPDTDEISQTLSALLLEHIHDGATIQLGIGAIPTAIGYGLKTRNDLGIFTELLTDPLVELVENGNVTNKYKGFLDGISVYAHALGTEKMYRALDNNPAYYTASFPFVNSPVNVAKNKNMISINAAMALNLFGEACSDCMGWKQQSATGGQVDFVVGAQWSEGGKSFIATPSSFMKNGKRVSKILPFFPDGSAVTTPRADIQYVATEYGCINLKNLNMGDRARAMIELAHPDFREMLRDEAKAHGLI